jgi:hypothetical protein
VAEPLAVAALQIGLLLAVLALIAGWRAYQRRIAFTATVEREHPELRHLQPDHDQLGLVAARAVDVHTPAAPRELHGWEAS